MIQFQCAKKDCLTFMYLRLTPLIGFWLTLLTLWGCQTGTPPPDNTSTQAATILSTATADIPNIGITPTPIETDEPENEVTTLTFWTVEEISPQAEGEPGVFIDNGLRVFRRVNPDLDLELLLRKPTGKGGTLDFLRTAKEVAPDVLPDIAIINATELGQAYDQNLIQPLDGRLDRSIAQDLLPAARRVGTIDDVLVGIPLGLEMEHTVYNTLDFETPPLQWTDILSSNTKYLFPAKGVNGLVNDLTLSLYFSTGGVFLDDQGDATLDEQALENVLTFYQQALENGIIDATLLETATTEELWPLYLESSTAG
ncbi:MAG: extracellular solute-binding protein, partial [Chloroflexota bacterium]